MSVRDLINSIIGNNNSVDRVKNITQSSAIKSTRGVGYPSGQGYKLDKKENVPVSDDPLETKIVYKLTKKIEEEITIESDDGNCSVTFKQIVRVEFEAPDGVTHVFNLT